MNKKKGLLYFGVLILMSFVVFACDFELDDCKSGGWVANSVYCLNESVSSTGTCMTIDNDNVTLEGDGFNITYGRGTFGSRYGVRVNARNNITIKDLKIIEGDTTGISKFAIFLSNSDYSSIHNNTILTNGSSGRGINIEDSSYNNIILNNISTSGGSSYGIRLTSSLFNVINNNTVLTTGNFAIGILLETSSNSNLVNFNVITTNNSNSWGLFLETVSNITFNSNILNISNADLIYSENSHNNSFINNPIINRNDLFNDVNYATSGQNGCEYVNQYLEKYSLSDQIIKFVNTESGEISFLQSVTGSGTNLSNDIQISDNFVYVDSSKTGLDKSAEITLYNLGTGLNRKILRDGVECDSGICTALTSLDIDTVSFNVTGWSNYSISNGDVPDVPEFSTWAMIVAISLTIAGLAYIRKKNS